ncbi:hypothetical protein ACF09L_33040 [Streptomyces sp. NPDC014779]|uniref:hypothetical protein n=1 Tax=unclassified Streptomyces TaxID=2593676 RepID=UPI0036FA07C0
MSFDDEWAQQKSAAAMRLNQLPADQGGGGSGKPDLGTTPARKRQAGNDIENHVQPKVREGADAADEGTNGAIAEFKGWDTAAGLKKAHEHWDTQVTRLQGRLGSERDSLKGTANAFMLNDLDTRYRFNAANSKITDVTQ